MWINLNGIDWRHTIGLTLSRQGDSLIISSGVIGKYIAFFMITSRHMGNSPHYKPFVNRPPMEQKNDASVMCLSNLDI